MTVVEEKQRLRTRMRSLLPPVSASARADAAHRAAAHLRSMLEFEDAKVLALYSAMSAELDTAAVFEAARRDGKRCVYPRCVDAETLEFVEVSDVQALRPGRFGILEPAAGLPAMGPAEIDLVLVPGLAFDRGGRRLGRGAGYYDRAFAGRPGDPTLVGFTYAAHLVENVPVESHDRVLDAIVTEAGLLRTSVDVIE